MMGKYEKKILNELLDKYESSKSFEGTNKVNQKFKVRISTLFPKYEDHSNYDLFRDINEEVEVLARKGLVKTKKSGGGVISEVYLNTEALDEVYRYIKRIPKNQINDRLERLIRKYCRNSEVLDSYLKDQLQRIRENRGVRFFSGDFDEFERVLVAVKELGNLQEEQFIREFSVQLYNDSKAFGHIQGKVESLLYDYGDYPEKEEILGNFNLFRTPTYVNFKGAGEICLSGQKIDLSKLDSDIAISSSMIDDIEAVQVFEGKVMTVENLTSFHRFNEKGYFVIYLGGFHNRVRRNFIRMLHDQNKETSFFHFGDIDAGGFLILEHLNRTTGIEFMPYKMDKDTLKKYEDNGKPLSENDRKRLKKLLDGQFRETVEYMLENNVKLEQEAIL
ncbi:Wadjet anti-phage system protein JetD domain-containing protein [Gudongella sp. SC589]|jgi:hypothetical protein|uniref:Wadjet anti-phage system protein JetD domain-containing protein n=1 Tax=Gudongella sp. SC589 TaxID=3385990 RepID=UPI003904D3D5